MNRERRYIFDLNILEHTLFVANELRLYVLKKETVSDYFGNCLFLSSYIQMHLQNVSAIPLASPMHRLNFVFILFDNFIGDRMDFIGDFVDAFFDIMSDIFGRTLKTLDEVTCVLFFIGFVI